LAVLEHDQKMPAVMEENHRVRQPLFMPQRRMPGTPMRRVAWSWPGLDEDRLARIAPAWFLCFELEAVR
jgi:hypothetical protein